MRLRTYIGFTSALLIIAILFVNLFQTTRILDRGFRKLGETELNRAGEIVKAVVKSKRDTLTNFKHLISADKEVTAAISQGRLTEKLEEMKDLGHFDFVDYIFPNGTSAFGNEKRFGPGVGIEKTVDDDGFSVVTIDGKILLVDFCLKHREHGILVLGYYLTGRFEKRLSELTGSSVQFIINEGRARKPSVAADTREQPTLLEVSQFPLRTLVAQIKLDWGWIEAIDSGLRSSLLYSGIISVLLLICSMYFFLEIGFVKRFESILNGVKRASHDLEEGRVPSIEFKDHPISDLQWLSRSITKFCESIRHYDRQSKEQAAEAIKAEQRAALTAQARQVAHDIRSPLSALELFLESFEQMPEEMRTIMKGCVSRVIDVSNTLLEKFKEAEAAPLEDTRSPELELIPGAKQNCLLAALIDPIVSEKRIQYKNRPGIKIKANYYPDSYGLFSLVTPQLFKRNLSNIIDNAVEAIEKDGEVNVTLRAAEGDKVRITVEDTGKGISPEVLAQVGKMGLTFGKKSGSGLGIYYTKKAVEEAGGIFTISSEPGKGTKVEALMVKAAIPGWFVPELRVTAGSKVVVLDDDPSIHHLWEERFKSLVSEGVVSLLHFSKASELIEHHDNATGLSSISLYLCDYELGQGENGLDVIEQLSISSRSVLITTHYNNEAIRKRSANLGIRLTSKRLARWVPIRVVKA
jgi:signal transduction histidine kinase